MRILFLYCRDLRCERRHRCGEDAVPEALDALQMNFDAEWRFSYDGGGECRVSRGHALPEAFFSHRAAGRICVSAVVGENGCGKTSVARMFHLLSLSPKGLRLLVVAEDQGRFHVWGSSVTVRFVAEEDDAAACACAQALNACKGRRINSADIISVLKFVYFSPVYTAQHVMDVGRRKTFNDQGSFFVDLSTTGLLRHGGGVSMSSGDGWRSFESRDALATWDFLRAIASRRRRKEPIGLHLPKVLGVKISLNWDSVGSAADVFAQKADEIRRQDGVVARALADSERARFISAVAALSAKWNKCAMFCAHALYACALAAWNDRMLEQEAEPTKSDWRLLNLLESIGPLTSRNTLKTVAAIKEMLSGGDKECAGAADGERLLRLFAAIASFHGRKLPGVKDGINAVLSTEARYDAFMSLLEVYAELNAHGDFLAFEPSPHMSSGEWSLLTMFARIYGKRRELAGRGVVLFLDEAETTLHPNLQRQLVSETIRFCESFLAESRVHVIFATHSPLLLSDIPQGNVVFVKKASGGPSNRCPTRCVLESGLPNTFGANIFDLYRESFFLKDGPIGEHARSVIRRVLKAIAERLSDADRLEDAKPSEDDGFRLEDWLDLIGDSLLGKYVEGLRSAGLLPRKS